jgi:endonuclease/exonuclease/phosphatase family metal-dependent hydrolase
MRIGTWNVEYAPRSKLDALRDVLRRNPADVWILTESHDDLEPDGCPHAAHASPRPTLGSKVRPGSRWVSIWSRHPILQSEAPPSTDPRRSVVALIDCGRHGPLLVYGTVMPWHADQGDDPQPNRLTNWSEHYRVLPLQCAEWRSLQDRYLGAALCVAGDFNTDLGAGGYGPKRGVDALREGMAACGLFCATEPGQLAPELLSPRPIDHIALPLAWRSRVRIASTWPKGRLSDHHGLVVEIAP